ncbi:hypothetical protein [Microbulbifer hydrolyticus]|uniref:Uncharacterized protein n=1 Tax=Microbulbifer hydrolyticus TaxID=48074 RepID=A0A6P1TDA8_9GAMM|nr:hypothetical protein [Microbulbifer hydrolyticus]MBB5210882.1 hypothetical protein [Microbulbifer hydrolyticus]QHQ38692.1 hypothetical protein GTQ55_06610 [Microbulbifer hydrolyticus]
MKWSIPLPVVRSAITEILSIVIGVLLALAVNEWNQNRIEKIRAAEAIENVVQEIRSNIKFMNVVHSNNRAVVELLKNESVHQDDADEKQFVPGLQIQDAAWKMLNSTGVSEFIDYETLYDISAIYSLQDIYKSLGYQLVETTMSNRALVAALSPDASKTLGGDLFMEDMLLIDSVEEALLSSYAKTLEKLERR